MSRQQPIRRYVAIVTQGEEFNVDVVDTDTEAAWTAKTVSQSILHGCDYPEHPSSHVHLKCAVPYTFWRLADGALLTQAEVLA